MGYTKNAYRLWDPAKRNTVIVSDIEFGPSPTENETMKEDTKQINQDLLPQRGTDNEEENGEENREETGQENEEKTKEKTTRKQTLKRKQKKKNRLMKTE